MATVVETLERCPSTSQVDVDAFIDPQHPLSWSRQMIALLEAGHYREAYQILEQRVPFVENQLRPYAERLAGKQNYWTRMFTWIQRYVDNTQPQRILDVGCGVGPFALEFARNGHQSWGIDVLEGMISRGRELADSLDLSERVHLQQGDIRHLEQHYDGHFFDVAIACDIFEHLEDDAIGEVLDGLCHVVKPGGTIIVQTSPGRFYYWFTPARRKLMALLTPMAWLPDRMFSKYVRLLESTVFRRVRDKHTSFYKHEYGHINCMTHEHLHRLLEQAGLCNISTFAAQAHAGFKDEGAMDAAWTRRLFAHKSAAARNVFGIATTPRGTK